MIPIQYLTISLREQIRNVTESVLPDPSARTATCTGCQAYAHMAN